MFKKILFSFFVFLFITNSYAQDINNQNPIIEQKVLEPKNTLYIELKDGVVIAELFPNVAPMHVQRIKTLAQSGFYDNVKFHRVIDGFMVQTGDPTGTGRGGSKLGRLYAEFNKEHHTRGTLSMARGSDVNSANSQFFIVTGDFFPELDGQYTVFGRVIEGMDYVDKIKTGDSTKNGMVDNPDVMLKVVTGDMLNNKSLETVKEEMAVINEMQDTKLKEDPNYKKTPVLSMLLEAKDIDINQDVKPETSEDETDEEAIKNEENGTENTQTINTTSPTTNNINNNQINNKNITK
ncbi:MAG TPA: peptidylprolyl isomerase [Rickettsiales bacterium]|nr:peptidylprolyl isomerase [Rickettsiales bacterium]